jgi:5-methylcytosine-specific restriction protein A
MNFEEFKASPKGKVVGHILSDPSWQAAMVSLSKHGLPAAQAVGSEIESRVARLEETERQHVGRWIRDILAEKGWTVDVRGARVAPGNLFVRAATYAAKADDFRSELHDQLEKAAKRGATSIEINSGELHRRVGGYPGAGHRMPVCCDVMNGERQDGDDVVSRPPKGKGASLTIRYRLPREYP